MKPYFSASLFFVCLSLPALAQNDTIKKQQTIDITSAYKPTARNTAKINFSAIPYRGDTARDVRAYEVPAQNLFYAYKPVTLKPLVLEQETGPVTGDRNMVKAGIGNYTTPYLRAALGIGDGQQYLLNFYGEYISSKGKLKYQQFSRLHLGASGSYFLKGNELYGTAVIRRDNNYLYGYDQAAFDYKKSDVLQQFQEFDLTVGFRNTEINELGLSYHPTVNLDIFKVKNKATETNFIADLPVQKSINDHFTARVGMRADLSAYSTGSNVADSTYKFNNNLVIIAPSLDYFSNSFNLRAGLSPAWNNGKFTILPDVKAEFSFRDKLMLHAGWVGRIRKNSYRNLTRVNPFLEPLRARVDNTEEIEFYGGLKAGLGKHFSFNASAGWISIRNMPLFINDTSKGGKGFNLVNEGKASNLRIRGGASYVKQEKFSASAEIVINGYTGFSRKAWHALPLELNADAAWFINKKLMVKGDLFLFAGGNYLTDDNQSGDLGGGVDLSLGAEYRIKKNLRAWLDVNNILNDRYERWHAYPVFGINLLGGISINF